MPQFVNEQLAWFMINWLILSSLTAVAVTLSYEGITFPTMWEGSYLFTRASLFLVSSISTKPKSLRFQPQSLLGEIKLQWDWRGWRCWGGVVLVRSRRAGAIHWILLLSVAMTTAAGIHLSSSQLQGTRQLAVRDALSVWFSLFSIRWLRGTTDERRLPWIFIWMSPSTDKLINMNRVETISRPRFCWECC